MTSGIFHLQPIQEIHFDRSSRQRKNIDDLDGLKESIKRLGLIHPIVITREHELVAGERRLASCRELGWTTIPIQFVDEVDPRILSCIEHEENTRRKNLTWQEENDTVVAQYKLWKDIEPEASVDKIGLFLNRSGSSIREHIEVKEERERSPSLERELTFKEAKKIAYNNKEKRAKDELYTHGATGAVHIQSPIINTDFISWAEEYDGPKFNLIHCDFPYGINSQDSGQNPSGYSDTPETYFQLLKSLSINLDNFCSPSAHLIFWFSSKFFCQTWELLKLLDGFQFDELPLIWVRDDQQGIVPDRHKRPRRIYETAFFGWRGDRSLIRVKNNAFIGPSPRGTHAHEKSQDALEYFFEMVVDGNTAIFDPTCGSGSALRAAKRLGAKQMLGLEINKEFADDALRALLATDDASSP
jgi:ParB/RepB/Spo0J family partition protein